MELAALMGIMVCVPFSFILRDVSFRQKKQTLKQ